MHTTWQSLAWKEWHEHKWKLVSITAILWGVIILVMLVEQRVPSDRLPLAAALVTFCTLPLAVFIGLGTAASEASRKTLPFLQALPVPMYCIATWKLLFGLVTLFVPILLAACLIYLSSLVPNVAGQTARAVSQLDVHSATGSWFVDLLLVASSVSASLFIWSAAAGVNRKDEVSAGAVALAVIANWYLAVIAFIYAISSFYGGSPSAEKDRLLATMVSTAPGGFVWSLSGAPHQQYWVFIAVAAVTTHAALVAWYISRFGRVASLERRSPKSVDRTATIADWLGRPRQSRFTAIAWKQFRESLPLVSAGLTGVVGIVTLFFVSDIGYMRSPGGFPEVFSGVSISLGFGIAMIVGIGVCLQDVTPGINSFWRSRPINPDAWFWTKYITGLLVLLTAINAPLLAILFALHPDPWRVVGDESALITPTVHLAIFAAAVAMTCLVRQAVYAAILSISLVYVGAVVGIGLWFVASLMGIVPGAQPSWWEPTNPQIAFGMLLSFVTSTIIAWLAMRYDWGRKSRY